MGLGLGKYIVDGNMGLRFSPLHASNILQLSTLEMALKETQKRFYALDTNNTIKEFPVDDSFNLLRLGLKEAENDGALRYISSTYDPLDQVIREGYYPGGRKIISFAHILQHNMFPLAKILNKVLKVGQREMGRPVEIEFAVNIRNQKEGAFYLLQIRPIVEGREMVSEDLSKIEKTQTILYSESALGNGISNDVYDVVYVKTESFDAANNLLVAREIEKLNKTFIESDRNYILIGPGRWGSSDPWLGIPVKWPHISQARLIVEVGLENYRVEPSQGAHFFQNLTSFGVGYFSIHPFWEDGGFFDEAFLNAQPAAHETDFIRHVHFDHPLTIKINGRKKIGVVMKPEK
jgi:hypothetical protein